MSTLYVNLLSALAISVIITAMVAIKSARAKSIVLILPIPITIALIGSGGHVTNLSVVGLMLTVGFIWGVYWLYRRGVNILVADVLASILYVGLAYLLAQTIHLGFWLVVTVFIVGWLITMQKLARSGFVSNPNQVNKTPLLARAILIFVIAFALFSMKQYLAAFVVTFPYNTIFAVYENRQNLLVQAVLFSRNVLALCAYFIANYVVNLSGHHWYAYLVSWTAFGIVIYILIKVLPLRITQK